MKSDTRIPPKITQIKGLIFRLQFIKISGQFVDRNIDRAYAFFLLVLKPKGK